MKTDILFLEGEKKFSRYEKNNIHKISLSTIADARRLLNVHHSMVFTIYKHGNVVNGYTSNRDWIRLTVPEFNTSLDELKATIYHEMNHIARGYSESQNITMGIDLLDAIVAEGLGTYFEMKLVPEILCPHGVYSLEVLKQSFASLQNNLKNKNYSHFEWFFGEGDKPNMFGYQMGKYIIDEYLKHNPDILIEDLTIMDSKKIWKQSKIDLEKNK